MERALFESQLKENKIYWLGNTKYKFIRRYQGWAHNRIGGLKIECYNIDAHKTVIDTYKPNRLWLENTKDNQFKYGK
jgi:hypothetical protein